MFERLQKKWKVGSLQLVFIISTFALGGSLTGYAGRKLINVFAIEQDWLWILVYILLVTLLWPLAVVLVSIPFGQFLFFMKYIRKIGKRVGLAGSSESRVKTDSELTTHDSRLTTRIVIFASGTGTNTQKIIDHFRNSSAVKIALIVCNNRHAGVLKIAAKENIPSLIIEKEKFFRGNAYTDELKEKQIDFIVLAGFMWMIPSLLISAWPNKILNIHPALLPKYGGKGMYGHYVHEAVIANKEKESGISIHYVDEICDHGPVIFQATCPVLENDTADSLALRIHALEHKHYPRVIEEILMSEV